jgi:hypothetical protein
MCPDDSSWIEFYVKRDVLLTSKDKIKSDAIYNDISICNAAPLSCDNILHEHPSNTGRGIINAYSEMIAKSKQACKKNDSARFIPFGTELITENFIDLVDYYHARGYAGLQGFFEWNGDETGMIKKIPLFSYIYHEIGPLRFDGFLKLSKEFGDIFYFIVARVILWGGIPELNYEFSAPELFEGMTGSTHYVTYDYWTNWIEDKSPYKVDPDKIKFLREAIQARKEFGKKYLVYGKMVRPPSINAEIPFIEVDYFHYNTFIEGGDKLRKGTIKVPSVLASAYLYKNETLGIFFVNLDRSRNIKISIKIDPSDYGLDIKNPSLVLKSDYKNVPLEKYYPRDEVEITLPPRKIGMVELTE